MVCKMPSIFFSVNSECRLNINIMRVIMRGSAKSTLPRSSKMQGIPSWLSYHFEKHKLGRGCSYFLSSFVKFHSMVAVKKLKMSIRGHLSFSIVLKNTNSLASSETHARLRYTYLPWVTTSIFPLNSLNMRELVTF